jgi:hypothetical protein
MSQLTVGTVVTGNASLTTQGLKLPSFSNAGRPATPNIGQLIYNTDEGKAQIWNGTDWDEVGGGIPEPLDVTRGSYLVSDGSNGVFWAYPGTTVASAPLTGFRYRSIITHGFLLAGYKGSQPWKTVNKTWHANDITFYCGEQLDRAGSYMDCCWSDYNGYAYGTVDSFTGNSSHTSSINLHTGVKRQQGDGTYQPSNYGFDGDDPRGVMGYNVAGGWDMPVGRDYHSGATAQIPQHGYNLGGGSTTVGKHHFPTEIMYSTNSSPGGGNCAACGDENYSWASMQANRAYIAHSNDSWAGWSSNAAPDGICKFLPSKYGHFYAGTGNNVTSPWTKYSGSTGAGLKDGTKVRAYGEENFEMGQDWGYLMGQYDGQQNNHTTKWNYTTDIETNLGAAARPKGHYGQSSGGCCSAAATVTAQRAL